MTEQTSEQTKEPLSYMKQWFLTKLQGQAVMEGIDKANDVPKIVISKGSDRSINRITTSPLMNYRASPIPTSWLKGDRFSGHRSPIESPCMTPMSARSDIVTSSSRRFYATPNTTKRKEKILSTSMPATPLERSTIHLNSPGYGSLKCASPLFRFPNSNIPNINMTPSTSKSELDYPGVCASCGQEKYYGSTDLIGFKDRPASVNGSTTTTRLLKRRNGRSLNLRRTISCRTTGNDKYEPFHTSAVSTSFDEQRRTTSCRLKKIQRTGSREKYRSTISLTRSWSINIDSLKVVKTSPNCNSNRTMSLNDNDLSRVNERRRSSLLRLLCVNQSDDDKSHDGESCNGSAMSFSSADDILTLSPVVTRTMKFSKAADPVEDFRSTFESDSIRIPSAYGQVKLMFQYFNEKNELQVTLLKCINVANGHLGTLGIYAKVCLMPGKLEKRISDDIHDTHDPVFYELFTLRMPLGDLMNKQLRIKLYNKPGIFSISQPVGECSIPLFDYDLTAVSVIWQNLKISNGQKKSDLDEFDLDLIEREKKSKRMFSALLCGLGRKP